MTRSIWRYSHFILALVSSLFLVIASLSGVVLALEPITHQAKAYQVENWERVPLGKTLTALKENYEEVFSLEVEASGFVKASILDADFESLDLYIDPNTGERLGLVKPRPAIYQFATSLHRSLFLKTPGRVFVGLISFLLCFIAVSGLLLLFQRQGGMRQSFSKVRDRNFNQRYHVILSRWFIIPIFIVAATGVYLSVEKFGLLPNTGHSQKKTKAVPQGTGENLFQKIKLKEVRKVEFPFSADPEDYYIIALKDRKIQLNQQTGQLVHLEQYPFTLLASRFSLLTHTGEGNVLWSGVLLLSSLSILFFMYTGFAISLKNRKKAISYQSTVSKEDAEYVILVGSEMGTTFTFAQRLLEALDHLGKKVFLGPLNAYGSFSQAKNVLILTATYGKGDATTNARKFEELLPQFPQKNLGYAVLGFGSKDYPDYCAYAEKVDSLLQNHPSFTPQLKLHKVNEQSEESFHSWIHALGDQLGLPLQVEENSKVPKKLLSFEVIGRSAVNIDDTFILRLKPRSNIAFASGDLLVVTPAGEKKARQYSIAKVENEIVLSIKKHEWGCCSNFLNQLKKGDRFSASLQTNAHFHLPDGAPAVVMIANGTGIAPFLGMLHARQDLDMLLLWGSRKKESLEIYQQYINEAQTRNKRLNFKTCHSQEDKPTYVQELVREEQVKLMSVLEAGGSLMLCGSLAMQNSVLQTLENILAQNNKPGLSVYENKNQINMDCY